MEGVVFTTLLFLLTGSRKKDIIIAKRGELVRVEKVEPDP
jgi:hypothetical protein